LCHHYYKDHQKNTVTREKRRRSFEAGGRVARRKSYFVHKNATTNVNIGVEVKEPEKTEYDKFFHALSEQGFKLSRFTRYFHSGQLRVYLFLGVLITLFSSLVFLMEGK